MADVKNDVINPDYSDKIVTIKEFRMDHAQGVSPQAIDYAIENDLIDYVVVGPRVRFIVLTEKTLKYAPNKSDKRHREVASL